MAIRRLMAQMLRFPCWQNTTISLSFLSFLTLAPISVSGTWTAPGICPLPYSLSVRTSRSTAPFFWSSSLAEICLMPKRPRKQIPLIKRYTMNTPSSILDAVSKIRSSCNIITQSVYKFTFCLLSPVSCLLSSVLRPLPPAHRQIDNELRAPRLVLYHLDRSAVVRDDLLHDGEAEAAAFFRSGEIRLEEPPHVLRRYPPPLLPAPPRPVLGRYPRPVVGDLHPHRFIRSQARRHPYRSLPLHNFDGIHDQVDEGPLHLLPVDQNIRNIGHDVLHEFDIFMGACVKLDHVLHHRRERLGNRGRPRQPRELRKLVQKPLESIHLPDDRPAALVEHRIEILCALRKFFPQSLGRELDRRERVLHLMGDFSRHILPGLRFLGSEKRGKVIKGDYRHHSSAVPQGRDPHPERQGTTPHRELQNLFGPPLRVVEPAKQVAEEVEHDEAERVIVHFAEYVLRMDAEYPCGGRINGGDPSHAVHGNNAGVDIRKDRLFIHDLLLDLFA